MHAYPEEPGRDWTLRGWLSLPALSATLLLRVPEVCRLGRRAAPADAGGITDPCAGPSAAQRESQRPDSSSARGSNGGDTERFWCKSATAGKGPMRRITQTPEQRRLGEVIRAAKALSTYPDISWESSRWKILQYDRNRRTHNRDSRDVVFTRRRKRPADSLVPFAAPYDDFAKSIIRMRASLRGVSSASQQGMILALRFLYEAASSIAAIRSHQPHAQAFPCCPG